MRKKLKVWAGILMLAIVLSLGAYYAWAKESGNTGVAGADYYPLKVGNKWAYKETVSDGTVMHHQEEVFNGGQDTFRVGLALNGKPFAEIHYRLTDDGIFKTKVISAKGVDDSKPYQKILPARINAGYTWNWESESKKAKETAEVVGFEKVAVPAGTFDAVLVQYAGNTEDGTAYTDKTWFVKGIGYVKNVSAAGGETTTIELTDYKLAK
jgi:hypothetical protein